MGWQFFNSLGDDPEVRNYSPTFLPALGLAHEVETVMLVAPHDDDPLLYAAGVIQYLRSNGKRCVIVVVTDGRLGFCDSNPFAYSGMFRICHTRKKEMKKSLKVLGWTDQEIKENLVFLDFPDGKLGKYEGARHPKFLLPWVSLLKKYGFRSWRRYFHMEGALASLLRQFNPQVIFLPTGKDLHNDHKVTFHSLLMSIFHGKGDIWPFLGEPLPAEPVVIQGGVYCGFGEPNLGMEMPDSAFETKLRAIGCFRSQRQIAQLINDVKVGGPAEFFGVVKFDWHDVAKLREKYFGGK